jgi:hypothetical protein
MIKKLQVLAVLMCMLSYVTAATVSIGTASARGEMRVDSYLVKGNATLFDGSVVETGQASADLRLGKLVEITMAKDSRGTLYRDRLVMQQGMTELAASREFQLQANGLHITPREPNSRGLVSLSTGKTVQVAAITGSLDVTNDRGVLLASLRPGLALSFASQEAAAPTAFSDMGLVNLENGHYYFTTNTNTKYELTCKDFKKFVDTKVGLQGTLQPAPGPTGAGGVPVICVSWIGINTPNGPYVGGVGTKDSLLILGGTGAAIATGLAIYKTNQPSRPASP